MIDPLREWGAWKAWLGDEQDPCTEALECRAPRCMVEGIRRGLEWPHSHWRPPCRSVEGRDDVPGNEGQDGPQALSEMLKRR
jgi:hypothetical protein